MDFLTQLLMGQTAPFTGSPGQAGFPAIIDPRNKLGGLRTQVLPDPLNPQAAAFPDQTYPPLGASLQPNNGVVPTTSTTNAEGQIIDEQGNPLPSYARGERPFGSSAVGGSNSTAGALTSGLGPIPGMGNMNAGSGGSKLLEALKGITAPRPPDVVKPSTPHLPPIRPIESGNLVQLMASLGVSPKDIPSLKSAIGR